MKFIRLNYLTFPYKVGTKVRHLNKGIHKFYTDGEIIYFDNGNIFVKFDLTIIPVTIAILDKKYKII